MQLQTLYNTRDLGGMETAMVTKSKEMPDSQRTTMTLPKRILELLQTWSESIIDLQDRP